MEKGVSLKKYIIWFVGAYVVSSVSIFAVLFYLQSNSSSPTFMIIFASALVTVSVFIKDNERSLTKNEIWTLTWFSWLSSIAITLVYILLILVWLIYLSGDVIDVSFSEAVSDIFRSIPVSASVLNGIIVFVLFLVLGLVRLSYGLSNKLISNRLPSNNQI